MSLTKASVFFQNLIITAYGCYHKSFIMQVNNLFTVHEYALKIIKVCSQLTRQNYVPKTSWCPQEVLICNLKVWIRSGTSPRHAEDVNLTIKWVFMFVFFLFFLILIVDQALCNQSKLKMWYILFWSYYGLGRLNQNRNIRVRPQDILSRMGNKKRLGFRTEKVNDQKFI